MTQDSVAERSEAIRQSPQFKELRRSFFRFIGPLTAAFLIWYLTYVILAGWAPGLFAISVWGNINVGLLLGLGQFVTTFTITMWYRRWADRKYDPEAAALRAQMESGELDEEAAR